MCSSSQKVVDINNGPKHLLVNCACDFSSKGLIGEKEDWFNTFNVVIYANMVQAYYPYTKR